MDAFFARSQLSSALKKDAEKNLDYVLNTKYAWCEISLSFKKRADYIPNAQLSKNSEIVKGIIIGKTAYLDPLDLKGIQIIHPTKEEENIFERKDSKGNLSLLNNYWCCVIK